MVLDNWWDSCQFFLLFIMRIMIIILDLSPSKITQCTEQIPLVWYQEVSRTCPNSKLDTCFLFPLLLQTPQILHSILSLLILFCQTPKYLQNININSMNAPGRYSIPSLHEKLQTCKLVVSQLSALFNKIMTILYI